MSSIYLQYKATILPATENYADLVAAVDKKIIFGEKDIEKYENKRIDDLYFQTIDEKKLNTPISNFDVIKKSDYIFFAPGSFYTSILASILPHNSIDAIKLSKSKKIMFQNLEEKNFIEKLKFFFDKTEGLLPDYLVSSDKGIEDELKKILADFYRIKKKYNIAINLYTELLEDNFEDAWSMFYLRGICYERSDNWGKAEKDFIESLKLKRNSPDVLNYLAYGWIERDMKIDESFVMLTDAYNANPDSYYILDSLAWVYYKKQDYKKAAELMEKVIDMVPGEAISLDHLGDIYYAMNRKREASFFWKQAKDLASPEDDIIEKIEKKLKEYNAI